jgi:DNA-directed RNA polymerase subunit RPC12/RpoP
MFCHSCGRAVELKEGIKFCPYCGADISGYSGVRETSKGAISDTSIERPDLCPYCGIKMDRRSKLKSSLGPWGFNPLGYALGAVKVKEEYICPSCRFRRDIGS